MLSIVRISLLLLFFTGGLFTSCAVSPLAVGDESLEPYIQEFSEVIGVERSKIDTIAVFKSSSKGGFGTIGICYYGFDYVTIDNEHWYESGINIYQKKSLVFHELAHCHCSERHFDETDEVDGCPLSLMHSTSIPPECLVNKWDKYMEDLKNRCN